MHCGAGELLYGWQWHRESIRKFHQVVEKSGASPESLLHLALEHWLQGPSPDTVATLHFGMVVHILSSLAGGHMHHVNKYGGTDILMLHFVMIK